MQAAPYTGPRATYVVLSAITTLVLCLCISIWHGDFSAVVAIVGLVAVYIGSSEMLVLFGVLAPFSLIIDIIWMSVDYEHHHTAHGWMIFFTVLDMLSKVVGTVMAWSLYSSGPGEVAYAPVNSGPTNYHGPQGDPFASYAPPGHAPASAPAPPPGLAPPQQAPAHTLV
mmetsp:Transcript_10909/g.32445  ORF Transcript_10909/g.32445 Transcript_10909/m.32445 type:complete len:169 (-) Transcript_10909:234-740(-)